MCILKRSQVSEMFWHEEKSEQCSPVFSATFAFSGSDVFTVNVRLLSVNTSINTAQSFTSYTSFWLSHLLTQRNRGQGEGGKKEIHVSTEAMCVMHTNISTLDFITTKTDKHICCNYTKGCKQWQRYQRGSWGTNNHSFLLGDSWLRLI